MASAVKTKFPSLHNPYQPQPCVYQVLLLPQWNSVLNVTHTTELHVATAGVANVTKRFPLSTNFSLISMKYFCWLLNLTASRPAGPRLFAESQA